MHIYRILPQDAINVAYPCEHFMPVQFLQDLQIPDPTNDNRSSVAGGHYLGLTLPRKKRSPCYLIRRMRKAFDDLKTEKIAQDP
jgi:hypothetical protein